MGAGWAAGGASELRAAADTAPGMGIVVGAALRTRVVFVAAVGAEARCRGIFLAAVGAIDHFYALLRRLLAESLVLLAESLLRSETLLLSAESGR